MASSLKKLYWITFLVSSAMLSLSLTAMIVKAGELVDWLFWIVATLFILSLFTTVTSIVNIWSMRYMTHVETFQPENV